MLDPFSDARVPAAPVGFAGGRFVVALLLLFDDFWGATSSDASSIMKESASESGDEERWLEREETRESGGDVDLGRVKSSSSDARERP